MFGLPALIAPMTVDEFVRDYRGRRAVYIPGDSDKFEELYNWDDINHYLNHGRPSLEGLRLVYEKKGLPSTELANIADWLTRGATLAINSVDQIDPIVAHLAAELGRDLNRHVNVNCYASCPAKQGFDNHYDRHDVFIAATAGRKAWKVFEATCRYPMERQTFAKGDPPDVEPYIDCEMSPGDMLYIPRGHWHYAVAVTPSVHLTIGPYSCSGIDFFDWLTDELMEREEFLRQDFPVVHIQSFGGERSDDEFDAHLDEFARRVGGFLQEKEQLKELFVRYCLTTMKPRRSFRLPDMALLRERLAPGTEFEMTPQQKAVVRYDPDTRKATIMIKGHVLELKNISAGVIESLLDGNGPISGERLMAADPKLEWGEVSQFLSLLFDRGVITLPEHD